MLSTLIPSHLLLPLMHTPRSPGQTIAVRIQKRHFLAVSITAGVAAPPLSEKSAVYNVPIPFDTYTPYRIASCVGGIKAYSRDGYSMCLTFSAKPLARSVIASPTSKNGSQLWQRALEKSPETVRILLCCTFSYL